MPERQRIATHLRVRITKQRQKRRPQPRLQQNDFQQSSMLQQYSLVMHQHNLMVSCHMQATVFTASRCMDNFDKTRL